MQDDLTDIVILADDDGNEKKVTILQLQSKRYKSLSCTSSAATKAIAPRKPSLSLEFHKMALKQEGYVRLTAKEFTELREWLLSASENDARTEHQDFVGVYVLYNRKKSGIMWDRAMRC